MGGNVIKYRRSKIPPKRVLAPTTLLSYSIILLKIEIIIIGQWSSIIDDFVSPHLFLNLSVAAKIRTFNFFGNFFCGLSINLVARWGQLAHFKEKEENFSRFGNFDKKRKIAEKTYYLAKRNKITVCLATCRK